MFRFRDAWIGSGLTRGDVLAYELLLVCWQLLTVCLGFNSSLMLSLRDGFVSMWCWFCDVWLTMIVKINGRFMRLWLWIVLWFFGCFAGFGCAKFGLPLCVCRFRFYSAGLEETESLACAEGKWICCWILELKHGRLCLDWDENFWIWDYLDMDKKRTWRLNK